MNNFEIVQYYIINGRGDSIFEDKRILKYLSDRLEFELNSFAEFQDIIVCLQMPAEHIIEVMEYAASTGKKGFIKYRRNKLTPDERLRIAAIASLNNREDILDLLI